MNKDTELIPRILSSALKQRLYSGKAIVLLGPRQTGKTTLLQSIIRDLNLPTLALNGDDPTIRALLTSPNTAEIKHIIGTHQMVVIDEAQRIPEIGLTAKIIIDQFPTVQLILSGSSALDLGNALQEPLTGRKWTFHLFPISWEEWYKHIGYVEMHQQLNLRVVFGMYPDVLNHPGEEKKILTELTSSYLYKDILALAGIKKPDILDRLLQALAFQIGHEVSLNELASLLHVDKNTVSHYINLLEKSFVIFRLPSFSRNLRNEIKFNKKVYFYDTGLRNAVIGNFQPLSQRIDKGALWENFVISERLKQLQHHQRHAKGYFWRTTRQQEIDYIEEENGQLRAFEIKWKSPKRLKVPTTFTKAYQANVSVISPNNVHTFLVEE